MPNTLISYLKDHLNYNKKIHKSQPQKHKKGARQECRTKLKLSTNTY